jgi:hypothetical protein
MRGKIREIYVLPSESKTDVSAKTKRIPKVKKAPERNWQKVGLTTLSEVVESHKVQIHHFKMSRGP